MVYCSTVKVRPGAKVMTIKPPQNAFTMDWAVEFLARGLSSPARSRKPSMLHLSEFGNTHAR
jgi:hypothetical protein